MKLLSFIFKKRKTKLEEENAKRPSYIFDSVFPNKEIFEIAMGINSEKKEK